MRIVVTGGSGVLGSKVVARVRELGHIAIPASRRWGVDLTTGQGLAAALTGSDAVVHCASSPVRPGRTDVEGTVQLLGALAAMPTPAHLVHVSIVGCDANRLPYYRAKVDSEDALARSGVNATIVRATQFHALAAVLGGAFRLGPLSFSLGDMRIQPVDIEWVAERLAQHAVGPAPSGFTRATDLAGPTAYDARQIADLLAAHDRRRPPRVLRVPPLGEVLRGFSEARIVPGPGAETGGRTFEEWLEAQPRPLPRRMHLPG